MTESAPFTGDPASPDANPFVRHVSCPSPVQPILPEREPLKPFSFPLETSVEREVRESIRTMAEELQAAVARAHEQVTHAIAWNWMNGHGSRVSSQSDGTQVVYTVDPIPGQPDLIEWEW